MPQLCLSCQHPFFQVYFSQFVCPVCYKSQYEKLSQFKKNRIKYFPQIVQIEEHLFLSNQDAIMAMDLGQDDKYRIDGVLAVGFFLEKGFCQPKVGKQAQEDITKEKSVEHKSVLVGDFQQQEISKYFQETNQWIKGMVNKGKNVVVHCSAGVSRSPSFVIAFLIGVRGMEFKQAYKYVKSIRPQINPNRGFIQQLKNYQLQIKKIK